MAEQNSSISNFSRFFARLLLPVAAVLTVVGLLFSYFFERQVILKSEVCGAYKVNRIITETHASEIPVFGSSRAAYGIIPDSLGADVFNYGLAGTGYDVTLFFLEQECRKQKGNPYIILNFDLEGMGYSLGDVSNYILNADNADVKALLGASYHAYFSIPFIKYYGRYEGYLRQLLSDRIELTKIVNKGASLEKNSLPQKEFDALVAERKATTTEFHNEPALQQRLLAIINAHPERKFIFVVAPYHSSYFERYSNMNQANAFLDSLRAISNVKLFNCSRMPLADSMFLNTTHINYKGAIAYNHALHDSLVAAGIK